MECSVPDGETPIAIIEEQFLWSDRRSCQVHCDPICIKLNAHGTIIYGKRLDRVTDHLANPSRNPFSPVLTLLFGVWICIGESTMKPGRSKASCI
jgi:hypothetical protein